MTWLWPMFFTGLFIGCLLGCPVGTWYERRYGWLEDDFTDGR